MTAPRVEKLAVGAYMVPPDGPEADGTLEWDSTTIIVVEARCDGATGLGYGYSHAAAANLIQSALGPCVEGRPAHGVRDAWAAMLRRVRNYGQRGVAMAAISAVDAALWDLSARLAGLPLCRLLGAEPRPVPIYGSGGFTSYPPERLEAQLARWVEDGIDHVKMKIGQRPDDDLDRVRLAREAIGPDAALMVDANGAYDRKTALRFAEAFAPLGVVWFEEPVSSDDLAGLKLLRDRAPAGMAIAAGEYADSAFYVRRMLEAQAVDVLQLDVTRCGGPTGFLEAASVAASFGIPVSAHTAPALHLHPCCAVRGLRHIEYFHDHVRIEALFFDGAPTPARGALTPDPARPGLGLTFRADEARRFKV